MVRPVSGPSVTAAPLPGHCWGSASGRSARLLTVLLYRTFAARVARFCAYTDISARQRDIETTSSPLSDTLRKASFLGGNPSHEAFRRSKVFQPGRHRVRRSRCHLPAGPLRHAGSPRANAEVDGCGQARRRTRRDRHPSGCPRRMGARRRGARSRCSSSRRPPGSRGAS